MAKSKCDKCGEVVDDLDAGFSPGAHGMAHDCGGTWRRLRAEGSKTHRPAPAVGQLWKVSGITYEIRSRKEPGQQYPFELVEVSRDEAVNREIESRLKGELSEARREVISWELEPRILWQEERWFELRTDVAHYVGEVSATVEVAS